MKFLRILYLTFFFVCCKNSIYSQDSISIMFYNVENLFDTEDDPIKNDNEFLPTSQKKWTNNKWFKKTHKIAQVITAANYPDIIGLCEIENITVLKKLTSSTLLWEEKYEIIHFESKDQRGIDVALIYKPEKLDLLSLKSISINLEGKRSTRDILSVILSSNKDTLALFVNHWPSRYGGKVKSAAKRLIAAKTLKKHMDSVKTNFPNIKIIAFGDFNDEKKDTSLSILNNYSFASFSYKGTIKYKGRWQTFDQFILSNNFTFNSKILNFKFLLEPDSKYKGVKPYRTYIGPKYKNGFSDHLPILLKL